MLYQEWVVNWTGLKTSMRSKIIIFEVKLTFEMLTLQGQQHSFWTHGRMFLWKCQSFWDRKCLDLSGTRTPNFWIHAKCSNHLNYQGQTSVKTFLYQILSFKVSLWISAQNILPIHCKMYIHFIHRYKNVLRFKSLWMFLRQSPGLFTFWASCCSTI